LKAINFSTYGASLLYIDATGKRVTPLYNYLKPYPGDLRQQFETTYNENDRLEVETSSPLMGHLNAGLQLYWLKECRPDLFRQVKSVLHFPQYLSYQLTKKPFAEMTNVGCHSAMWSFRDMGYHPWLQQEGLQDKLSPVINGNHATVVNWGTDSDSIAVGVGLHDSSAAVIPYLTSFSEPFVIVSTGTWTVSLNPFNKEMPRAGELKKGCLSYLTYEGEPVKSSMVFAGHDHDQQVKKIAAHFNTDVAYFRTLAYDAACIDQINQSAAESPFHKDKTFDSPTEPCLFHLRNLAHFNSASEAYHQLLADVISRQVIATQMVTVNSYVKKIYVDGGFCNNGIYMQLLTDSFPEMEVYSTSMIQGTALGAALAIHDHWNMKPLPSSLITLKHWPKSAG